MNSNNDDDKIYTLYESAVEWYYFCIIYYLILLMNFLFSSDVYLQLLAQCKANDTLNQNWQKLEDVHTNFSNIIENLIQLEENDLFFVSYTFIFNL